MEFAKTSGPTGSALAGRRVLVVDDHDDSRALLSIVLRRVGAAVIAVGSAPEALEALGREKVDLLVSDYNMPGFDGLWLIGRVRALPNEQGGRVPAVLITAYGNPELSRRACESGFHSCHDKPLEAAAFLADAERLVREAP